MKKMIVAVVCFAFAIGVVCGNSEIENYGKAGEQGENGAANGSWYGLSQGGWMHWRTRDTDGAGYGAGAAYETTAGTSPDMAKRTSSHSGALVLRIAA